MLLKRLIDTKFEGLLGHERTSGHLFFFGRKLQKDGLQNKTILVKPFILMLEYLKQAKCIV